MPPILEVLCGVTVGFADFRADLPPLLPAGLLPLEAEPGAEIPESRRRKDATAGDASLQPQANCQGFPWQVVAAIACVLAGRSGGPSR